MPTRKPLLTSAILLAGPTITGKHLPEESGCNSGWPAVRRTGGESSIKPRLVMSPADPRSVGVLAGAIVAKRLHQSGNTGRRSAGRGWPPAGRRSFDSYNSLPVKNTLERLPGSTIMGLWSTMKGWLNIGGVKVILFKYTEPLSKANPVLAGTVLLKTKSDKTVTGLEVKVIEELTTTVGEGEDKKKETETTVLGSVKFPDHDPGLGYPLDLKPGQDREQPFTLNVRLTTRLQNFSGVIGGLGKMAAFASGEKVEYFLVAEAGVKGAAFAASAREKLKIAP